jgi:hypothetical protein
MNTAALERAALAWNRSRLDLASDEILAQIMDRGDLASWRELYALASVDVAMRARILRIVERVPIPYPHFWLAALASLGEPIDWTVALPHEIGP